MSRRLDGRTRAGLPSSEVHLEIGELILSGVPAADRPRVAEAVRSRLAGALGTELSRRLGSAASPGASPGVSHGISHWGSAAVELPVLRLSLASLPGSPAFGSALGSAVGSAVSSALDSMSGPAAGAPTAAASSPVSAPLTAPAEPSPDLPDSGKSHTAAPAAVYRAVSVAPSTLRPGRSGSSSAPAGPSPAGASAAVRTGAPPARGIAK